MTSAARQFFERFQGQSSDQEKLAFLRGLISSQHEETEWLDFKGGREGPEEESKPLNKNTIRKLWSKNLSAFANTAGGVLIFGIDATKNAEGIDAAQGERLVPEPTKLKQTLSDQLLTITDPPVPGVEIVAVEDPDQEGHGFLVCLIPESQFKPHRATEKSLQRYFFRIGDSNNVPGTSLLRTMFFPQERTRLTLIFSFTTTYSKPGGVGLKIAMRNDGPASLEDGDMRFEIRNGRLNTSGEPSVSAHDASMWDLLPDSANGQTTGTAWQNSRLHPGDQHTLMYYSYDGDRSGWNELTFSATVFSRDQRPNYFQSTFDRYQINRNHPITLQPTFEPTET